MIGNSLRIQNFTEALWGKEATLLGKEKTMSWITIYITGKTDFREDVRKKLEHSDQRYMPGYVENLSGEATHDLYWLDGLTDLHAFKEAIGGKLIWKHRLRFYSTLEAFIASQQQNQENTFSDREQEMIAEMQHAE
jgi:hypothetical protein